MPDEDTASSTPQPAYKTGITISLLFRYNYKLFYDVRFNERRIMVMYGIPKRSGRYPWKSSNVFEKIRVKFWTIVGKCMYKIGYLKDDEA